MGGRLETGVLWEVQERDGVISERMPDKVGAIIACETSVGDPAFRCATACVCRKAERQQGSRD